MTTDKFMIACDVCNGSFQFGPNCYEGQKNQTYDIMVCNICHDANWDGWAPHCETRVTRILEAKGLTLPLRNEKGWLPRE